MLMTGRACRGGVVARRSMISIGAQQPSEGYIKKSKMMHENSTIFRCNGTGLFLEEIFESLASVGRTAGNGLRKSSGDLRGLLIGGGSGVLFDGGAEFVKLAIVFAVLGSDALRDGLRTFKLRTGIEEAALFAAM